jgi:glutamate N-acetyltransferase/amino-acid N-acetyltransferase
MAGDLPVSPLAPKTLPKMPQIAGVSLRSGKCGIKKNGNLDFFIASFDKGTSVAGVLTTSKTRSAAVDWCRKSLKTGKARAFIANAGNSNAFTGKVGETAMKKTVDATAKLLGCPSSEVFVASTGVIGVPLPAEKITNNLGDISKNGLTGWADACKAFSTTDTFIKLSTRKVGSVTINGMSKGSGMIAPDMATMLAFVATDAKVTSAQLQKMLSEINEQTFNSITVDSDTSTSDTLLVFATNKKKVDLAKFKKALHEVIHELAMLVVKDGEGATKFITIKVTGAASDKAAKKIGLSIANSPLVKTAIAGEDANWGRIVAAVGKSGEKANRDKLTVGIGGVTIAKNGQIAKNYDEAPVAKHMKGQNIDIFTDIGVGNGKATVYTCDLTHGYISINADYRS